MVDQLITALRCQPSGGTKNASLAASQRPPPAAGNDLSLPNISTLPLLFFFFQIEDMRLEVQRKEQDLMQLQAKMKTVEEQHADYQKHIAVLKESLIAKEEHYNMLQMDVSSFTFQVRCTQYDSIRDV